jgi:hypothetical protein
LDSTKVEDKVDLKQNFKVELNGTLTPEGKFDPEKTKFIPTKPEGDPKMVEVAKNAIKALGDSTLFVYLKDLGVEKVNIVLVQDEKQISAIIRSSQPTEEKARSVKSGFNLIIGFAKTNTQDDAEVQALLKGVKFNSDGKNFIINFEMPKDEAHQLIDKKLEEARQKKSQTQNSVGVKNTTVTVK